MGSNTTDFAAIPILDYSLISSPSTTRTKFLDQLRDTLINIGFLYLSNHPISQTDTDLLINYYLPQVFGLPLDAKEEINKIHSPYFFGYSRLGAELTKHVVDQREQFDFALGNPIYPWKEGDAEYYKLLGPSQWPEEALVPGFRTLFERYLKQVEDLGYAFSSLISESLGLGPNGFDRFFEQPELVQHRAKIVKYPVITEGLSSQGVGPHVDGGFLTFLLQASDHKGLQVQNLSGEWIDALPIPGTLVVNIGRVLEFVTQGLMRATLHQVVSPSGSSPRYSVPFFHHVGMNLNLPDHVLTLSPDITSLKRDDVGGKGPEATDLLHVYKREPVGKATLMVRVRSHPDVAEKYYPDFLQSLLM